MEYIETETIKGASDPSNVYTEMGCLLLHVYSYILANRLMLLILPRNSYLRISQIILTLIATYIYNITISS